MLRKIILLSCLFSLVSLPFAQAQEDPYAPSRDPFAEETADTGHQGTLQLQVPLSAPQQNIVLKDGTVLKGRLIGVESNVYLIETQTLGTVPVAIDNVSSINAGSAQPAFPGGNSGMPGMDMSGLAGSLGANSAPMQQLQRDILSDPELMKEIQAMMSDPELMALIANGNLMSTISTMDPAQAQNDPRIQKLMQNPAMQRFMEKVKQKYSAPSGQNY